MQSMVKRNDLDVDTLDDQDGIGGRGLERSTHGPFLAIRNFFENQQEIKLLRRGDANMIKIIQNEVLAWNEESLNFRMSATENLEPDKRMIEFSESSMMDNLTPEHYIHTMNLGKVSNKWTTITNVSSRDDIQGGELIFKRWSEPKRHGNYGEVVGDDNCQPQWINELGTLIIFPSIEAWGYKLVVSGQGMRTIVNFKGEGYK